MPRFSLFYQEISIFEIREKTRDLPNGTKITTFIREVIIMLGIETEAGTTGFKGCDTAVADEPFSTPPTKETAKFFVKTTNGRNGNSGEVEFNLGGN